MMMTDRKTNPAFEDATRHRLVQKAERICNYYEIPTWIVIFSVYGAWLTLTMYFHTIPLWAMAVLAPLTIAWHGSLRHEATHNHPMNRTVATLIGYPPLGLLDAFPLYRATHIQHHRNEHLTDPDADPESFYVHRRDWVRMPRFWRAVLLANQTFAGRMLLGPAISYGRFYARELGALLRGDMRHARAWAEHVLLVAAVLYWVVVVCGIPAWQYVLLFVYPGASVAMIRSFYEHRYEAEPLGRCVIVERSPFFQLLFLNNNYHAVHHDKPGLPWYMLDEHYRAWQADYAPAGKSYHVLTYGGLMWHYLFRPIFHPVHPLEAAPQELALESRIDEVTPAPALVKPFDDDTRVA